jgi:hypothetical protein
LAMAGVVGLERKRPINWCCLPTLVGSMGRRLWGTDPVVFILNFSKTKLCSF